MHKVGLGSAKLKLGGQAGSGWVRLGWVTMGWGIVSGWGVRSYAEHRLGQVLVCSSGLG